MAFTVTKDTIIGDIMDADENTAHTLWKWVCTVCSALRQEAKLLRRLVLFMAFLLRKCSKSSTSILQNKRLELFSPPSRLFRGRAAIFFFGGQLWIKDL